MTKSYHTDCFGGRGKKTKFIMEAVSAQTLVKFNLPVTDKPVHMIT